MACALEAIDAFYINKDEVMELVQYFSVHCYLAKSEDTYVSVQPIMVLNRLHIHLCL